MTEEDEFGRWMLSQRQVRHNRIHSRRISRQENKESADIGQQSKFTVLERMETEDNVGNRTKKYRRESAETTESRQFSVRRNDGPKKQHQKS